MENTDNVRDKKFFCAKHYADKSFKDLQDAGRRGSELADQFTSLEVQIATILFAFTGFFLDSFVNKLNILQVPTHNFSQGGILLMKITFALIVFCLISSLAFGLIHIKRKEKFWDGFFKQKLSRALEWEKVFTEEKSYEHAKAFHEGTSNGNITAIHVSPMWTWVLQTIFLGLAIIPMFVLFLVFLFH